MKVRFLPLLVGLVCWHTVALQAQPQTDTDNDGVNNYREGKDGTDPNDPNSFNPLSKGLVLYYQLDGNKLDTSGHFNDLTNSTSGFAFTTDRFGAPSSAAYFTGPNDGADSEQSLGITGNQSRTISFWFKATSSGAFFHMGNRVVETEPDRATAFGIIANVSQTNTIFCAWGNWADAWTEEVIIPEGAPQWRHLVYSYAGNKVGDAKLYIDGRLLVFTQSSDAEFKTIDGPIALGQNFLGPIFSRTIADSSLDEFRVYNRALSPAEVSQLYQTEAGNLIINGSFEAPVITGPWVRFISPSNEIPGWSVSSGEIDISRGEWIAHHGEQSVDLVGLGVMGEVGQIVPTEPGAAYQLSFHYGNNPRPVPASAAVRVSENGGGLIKELVVTHSGSEFSDMKWPRATVEFVASSSSTRISFAATSEFQDGGICIDSVELTKLVGMPDTDGDGIPDAYETNTGVYVSPTDTGTDPNNPDSDGDGLNDRVETNTGVWVSATDTGTDPNLPDTDGDGLNDAVETNTGTYASATNTGTNPLLDDTSGDGITDGEAVAAQFNPLIDQRPVLNFLTQAVAAQPNRFGFYNEANVMHLGMGGLMIRKSGSVVNLDLQWQTKNSLTNAWTNHGAPLPFFLNLPGSKAFIRLQATPGAP